MLLIKMINFKRIIMPILFTCVAVFPVAPVFGYEAEENVENTQEDGKGCTQS